MKEDDRQYYLEMMKKHNEIEKLRQKELLLWVEKYINDDTTKQQEIEECWMSHSSDGLTKYGYYN